MNRVHPYLPSTPVSRRLASINIYFGDAVEGVLGIAMPYNPHVAGRHIAEVVGFLLVCCTATYAAVNGSPRRARPGGLNIKPGSTLATFMESDRHLSHRFGAA